MSWRTLPHCRHCARITCLHDPSWLGGLAGGWIEGVGNERPAADLVCKTVLCATGNCAPLAHGAWQGPHYTAWGCSSRRRARQGWGVGGGTSVRGNEHKGRAVSFISPPTPIHDSHTPSNGDEMRSPPLLCRRRKIAPKSRRPWLWLCHHRQGSRPRPPMAGPLPLRPPTLDRPPRPTPPFLPATSLEGLQGGDRAAFTPSAHVHSLLSIQSGSDGHQ